MADKETVVLQIGGMNCSACAAGIEKKLKQNGLTGVNVSFPNAEAVFHNPEQIPMDKIFSEIESLGYQILDKGNHEANTGWSIARKFWFCLAFTLPLVMHMFFPESFLGKPMVQLLLSIPVMAMGIWHFGKSAVGSIKINMPNMDVLILMGSSAAFVYSLYAFYTEESHAHHYLFFETSASIITLVLLGNLIEKHTVSQTTTALKDLINLQPREAKRLSLYLGKEKQESISVNEINTGDLLLISSGDGVPADGRIYFGEGVMDNRTMTGESAPVFVKAGDHVQTGTILTDGLLKIQVEKTGNETALAGIINLVRETQRSRPPIQKTGDKISAVFVPVVLGIAVVTFIAAYVFFNKSLSASLLQSVAVLVISCPCAMGLATPTAVMAGLGRAGKSGILVKSGLAMENLANADIFIFDKTGTLTTGNFKIGSFNILGASEENFVQRVIFSLEKHSNHPVALSLCRALGNGHTAIDFINLKEVKGGGMEAEDEAGNRYKLGSPLWCMPGEARYADVDLLLLINEKPAATLTIQDEERTGARELIQLLKTNGKRVIMLSGDNEKKCFETAGRLGITEVYAAQNPTQKLLRVEEFNKTGLTVMTGDGINDAPALAKATVSISMSDAADVAVNSSQIVLMHHQSLLTVWDAYRICTQTLQTIRQNLFWAFFYNVCAIPVAAFGFLSPIIAAFSMSFSDVMVIGNSLRLKFRKIN